MPDPNALLTWYDRHRRTLPWRALPGEAVDPYRVWLSEIMLQQTTVTAVIPYFLRFLDRFPTVGDLAAAESEAVMQAWAGLGYYARARNLHACAKAVAAQGGFPVTLDGLRALPGIGPYTAAAIGAIAFGIPAVPVDGNVERVTSRLFAIDTPLPAAKPALAAAAATLMRDDAVTRPSDFAQALFDLGATICTPTNPACALCPLRQDCAAFAAGIAADLPRKTPKKARPVRHGVVFCLVDANGAVLLRTRPPSGLYGGMQELPGTSWELEAWSWQDAASHAPMRAIWQSRGEVHHVLTHFELRLQVYVAEVRSIQAEGVTCPRNRLADAALPSVMRKCLKIAL